MKKLEVKEGAKRGLKGRVSLYALVEFSDAFLPREIGLLDAKVVGEQVEKYKELLAARLRTQASKITAADVVFEEISIPRL